MNKFNEINGCEVCDNKEIISVLDLGMHPMCDDLIKVGDERINDEFPIQIVYCKKCFTAHQKYQIPKNKLFPSDYHYRAKFTKDVLDGMQQLVNNIEEKFGSLKGKKVLDVGCNDGSLLNFFKEKGALTYGVEPTDAALEARNNGHFIINDYFTHELSKKLEKPDVITFTNVFAHIEDLNGLIQGLKILMKKETILVIENHYLGAVLEKNQFDTFYHEHPRTYSLNSFNFIAEKLNKNILHYEFPSRYNGNVRIFIGEGTSTQNDIEEILKNESYFFIKLQEMNRSISEWKETKRKEILDAVEKYGPLKAKAFPGRAAIPVKILELNENHIQCTHEKPGSLKIGYKIPGTQIPIVSDDEFGDLSKIPVILNLAWHISNEIEKYLRMKGFAGKFINII